LSRTLIVFFPVFFFCKARPLQGLVINLIAEKGSALLLPASPMSHGLCPRPVVLAQSPMVYRTRLTRSFNYRLWISRRPFSSPLQISVPSSHSLDDLASWAPGSHLGKARSLLGFEIQYRLGALLCTPSVKRRSRSVWKILPYSRFEISCFFVFRSANRALRRDC